MRRHRILLTCALLVTLAAGVWRLSPPRARNDLPAADPARPAQLPPLAAREEPRAAPPEDVAATGDRPGSIAQPATRGSPAPELQRLTYATAWHDPMPPEIAAFRDWVDQYLAAAPGERAALESAGMTLAAARRPAFRELMRRDPQQALATTVPEAIRSLLPAAIAAELETRFSTRGDLILLVVDYSVGEAARRRLLGLPANPYEYRVTLDGQEYPASVYGRRLGQSTKHALPLHGLRLDGMVALHESPLRVLEPAEVPAAGGVGASGWPAELAGRVLPFESPADVRRADARLAEAERGIGPALREMPAAAGAPAGSDAEVTPPETAAAAATSWTVGNKAVLVIRVDFSDLPGEPRRGSTIYTPAYAQNLADTQVDPFYQQSSYGTTSLTTTVTPEVYRMPQTAAHYATTNANTQLHTDARTAAAAHHAVTSYDRIVVLFSSLSGVSGSQITYGGLAQVGAKNVWLNGGFDFRLVTHELGHTYGLRHANLWQVSDGNPVSGAGSSTEYGDPFDIMGSNFANDRRTDFNPWFKNLLGWLQDSQVQTVTTTGTYRIARFDHQSAAGKLAVVVNRDSTRKYWIGARRNFTTNPTMQQGAYVIWGYNTNRASDLIDINTPGNTVSDAALSLGATLLDAEGNTSLRAAAIGGTSPAEFLDVDVTVGLNGMPVITAEPQTQGFALGATVVLSVTVTGTGPMSYQWLKNDVPIAGATSSSLTLTNAQHGDAGTYRVRITNAIASVLSAPAVIAVNAAPGIYRHPVNTTTAANRLVTLAVSATGSPAPTYQWRKNGVNITSATTATLTFPNVQPGDAGNYDVTVTNSFGSVGSAIAVLTVHPASTPPANDAFAAAWALLGDAGTAIGTNSGATGESGEPVHVIGNGTATSVWYRWTPQTNGVAQVDTIGSSFDTVLAVYTGSSVVALTKVGEDDQSGGLNTSKLVFPATAGVTYSIAVGDFSSTRLGGSIALQYGVFTVPAINAHPVNQVSTVGGTAMFSVSATGTRLAYQWFRNGVALPGATNPVLYLSKLSPSDAGSYFVVASNLAGTITSNSATLSGSNAAPVISTPPAGLVATAGESPTLSVTATGTDPLTYQWRRNAVPITGATGASLTLADISRTDADYYDVVVAAGLSLATSPAVRVAVAPKSYPTLVAPDPAWELRPEAGSGGLFGYAIVPLADGGAYLAGSFVSLDGVRRAGVARIKADGTLDSSFLPPEIDNPVRALALQPDGKLVIGGDFVRVNGLLTGRLARLNSDGSVDTSFRAGAGANDSVQALAVQADGRILVGGWFTGFAGTFRNYLTRLNADGSVDNGFLTRGMSSGVYALAVQGDGKVLVGGTYSVGYYDINGVQIARSRLARLNADGTLDTTYNPAPNGTVYALALQADGRAVIGGSFTTVLANSAVRIARINANGSIDTSFNSGGSGFDGTVSALALEPDGQILAGGSFLAFNGAAATRFARLNSNGTRDTAFQTLGFNGSALSVAVLPGGQIVVGGGFSSHLNPSNVGTTRIRFARMDAAGALDAGVNFAVRTAGSVNAIVPLADGKLLVSGYFTTLRGAVVPTGLARLNPDGAVDTTFNNGGTGASSNIYAALAQPDGRIIIAGAFTAYNGTAVNRIARLQPDGTLDPTFAPGTGISGSVYTLAPLAGGRILVAGSFTSVQGVTRNRVAALTSNGQLDTSFNPGAGPDGSVWCSAVQPDGRILLGGAFTTFSGTQASRIVRLNANGSHDLTFATGSGANSDVVTLALQPDGRVLIGGYFTSVYGNARSGLARLFDGGTLDGGFIPPALNDVSSVLVQEDGRIVVRGSFASAGQPASAFLTRLHPDGRVDAAFASGGLTVSSGFPTRLAMGDGGQLFMQSDGSAGLSGTQVAALPTISSAPVSQTFRLGGTVSFSVTAGSPLPMTYQWFHNGNPIAGAVHPVLTLSNAQASAAGSYTVVVTTELGSTTSSAAVLSTGPEFGLLSGTTMAPAGSGPATLVGSFTIEAGSKSMLIRAVGPTLSTLGVNGVLADPRLEIVNATSGAVVASNDDWHTASNAAQVSSAGAQAGALALPAGSKDAAVLVVLPPGTYLARVGGADSAAGTALLEIYDADTTPRVVQVAARIHVPATGATMGFLVESAPAGRSYLLRALGPSLGHPGALPDPRITVRSGDQIVAANDNWGGSAALATLAANAGAMPLAPDSRDAVVNMVPTARTGLNVTIEGVGGATGFALVELFEVDAQRATALPAAIVSPPEDVIGLVGRPVRFGVVTIGKPAPSYQWRRNGVAIAGATLAHHTIDAAAIADAGGYDVVVSNAGATATSRAAALVMQGATHETTSSGYTAAGTLTVTNTIHYSGSPTRLDWAATIPAGWSYVAGAGTEGDTKPSAGATGTLSWSWSSPPPSPVTFAYTLNIPAGETGTRSISASATIVRSGAPTSVAAAPAPLQIAPAGSAHSADVNGDFQIDLVELTRVIELYNTRLGTTRTGCYAVSPTGEDGFAGDPTRAADLSATLGRYHAADSNRNARIELGELTRVIQLYNQRVGTVRHGRYHVQAGTEDGFAVGP